MSDRGPAEHPDEPPVRAETPGRKGRSLLAVGTYVSGQTATAYAQKVMNTNTALYAITSAVLTVSNAAQVATMAMGTSNYPSQSTLPDGLILSTGPAHWGVVNVTNPSTKSSACYVAGANALKVYDGSAQVFPGLIFDPAQLNFTITPNFDGALSFTYVFASEEYPVSRQKAAEGWVREGGQAGGWVTEQSPFS